MHLISTRPTILDEIQKTLIMTDKERIPILIHKDPINFESPFDKAVNGKKLSCIKTLLEIMIKH